MFKSHRIYINCSCFLSHSAEREYAAILETYSYYYRGFPSGSASKESSCNGGDLGSIPGSGRSPGEGNGNPFQYSCPGNPMDRKAWRASVHGVAELGYDSMDALRLHLMNKMHVLKASSPRYYTLPASVNYLPYISSYIPLKV